MIFQIEHSGRTFTSTRRGPFGCAVWPIEEYLVRANHSRAVAERIARCNPDGKEEGSLPRGWRPHHRINKYERGCAGVREFIAKHGRPAYVALPKHAVFRRGHRKAVALWAMREAGS